MAAVRIIIERAPSTVVDKLVEYATTHAGKYGEPKGKEE